VNPQITTSVQYCLHSVFSYAFFYYFDLLLTKHHIHITFISLLFLLADNNDTETDRFVHVFVITCIV